MIIWTSCEQCHTAQELDNITCKECGIKLKELDSQNWRDLIIPETKNKRVITFGSTNDY